MQETMLRAFLYADRLWTDDAAQRRWLFRVRHNVAVTNFAKADLVVEFGDETA
jgi:DNA-directed RNA polymerase specialized sigma24 family protein